jgi:hypothetical protein
MGTTIFFERYLGRQQGIKYNENNVSDVKKSYKLMAFFFLKRKSLWEMQPVPKSSNFNVYSSFCNIDKYPAEFLLFSNLMAVCSYIIKTV